MVHTIGNVWCFVNHNETNLDTRIVLWYIWLNSGLRSNLLRKTAITTTFYFPAEEGSTCLRKNWWVQIAWATILMQAFCNTHSDFQMVKVMPRRWSTPWDFLFSLIYEPEKQLFSRLKEPPHQYFYFYYILL